MDSRVFVVPVAVPGQTVQLFHYPGHQAIDWEEGQPVLRAATGEVARRFPAGARFAGYPFELPFPEPA